MSVCTSLSASVSKMLKSYWLTFSSCLNTLFTLTNIGYSFVPCGKSPQIPLKMSEFSTRTNHCITLSLLLHYKLGFPFKLLNEIVKKKYIYIYIYINWVRFCGILQFLSIWYLTIIIIIIIIIIVIIITCITT